MGSTVRSVALFTDFGAVDSYQGEMKAVLHSALPSMPVYDLMAGAPRFNPRASAYLLAALLKSLPLETLVVAVVDPGVGSDRKVLRVEAGGHVLIGPDNGLLAMAAKHFAGRIEEVRWRPAQLSNSFHGRDLFVPAAIRYITNRDLGLGPLDVDEIVGADWPDDIAEIIHIDGYGNLVTGLRSSRLSPETVIDYADRLFSRADTFFDCSPGEGFWYENSAGLVELALNQASAAERFAAGIGDPIVLRG